MANNYDQIITKTLTKISETGEVNASDVSERCSPSLHAPSDDGCSRH